MTYQRCRIHTPVRHIIIYCLLYSWFPTSKLTNLPIVISLTSPIFFCTVKNCIRVITMQFRKILLFKMTGVLTAAFYSSPLFSAPLMAVGQSFKFVLISALDLHFYHCSHMILHDGLLSLNNPIYQISVPNVFYLKVSSLLQDKKPFWRYTTSRLIENWEREDSYSFHEQIYRIQYCLLGMSTQESFTWNVCAGYTASLSGLMWSSSLMHWLTLQNMRWDHPFLPQVWHYVACHSLIYR